MARLSALSGIADSTASTDERSGHGKAWNSVLLVAL
jgi:hypothetical protein